MKQTVGTVVAVCGLALAPALVYAQAYPPPSPKTQTQTKAKGSKSGETKEAQTKGAAGADNAFVREAAAGGMAEVELGRLASEKASSPDVKQFGDRMVTDHGKANDELKQLAQQKNITLPTELDAKHKATRDRLAKLSGAAFDKAYMTDMVADHQKDVAAFKHESTAGKDGDVKSWAGKTLPTLEDHLKMAQDTKGKVAGATGTKGTTKGKGKGKQK
jgi:putative membrane protein